MQAKTYTLDAANVLNSFYTVMAKIDFANNRTKKAIIKLLRREQLLITGDDKKEFIQAFIDHIGREGLQVSAGILDADEVYTIKYLIMHLMQVISFYRTNDLQTALDQVSPIAEDEKIYSDFVKYLTINLG